MQYFERAVFEMHPENELPYDVLLSQLGTFRYRAKYTSAEGGATPTTSRTATAMPPVPARTWAGAAPMLLYRSERAAAVFGGKIYVVGGFSGGSNIYQRVANEVEVYDPATNRWQSLGDAPLARHGLPSVELGGKWYVLGGGTSAADETFCTLTNRVDVFTPSGR